MIVVARKPTAYTKVRHISNYYKHPIGIAMLFDRYNALLELVARKLTAYTQECDLRNYLKHPIGVAMLFDRYYALLEW